MGDFDKAKVLHRQNFAIAGSMIIEAESLFIEFQEGKTKRKQRKFFYSQVKGSNDNLSGRNETNVLKNVR